MDYGTNGYLSIPLNRSNAIWFSEGSTNPVQLFAKEDSSLFCYYCWYQLTIVTNVSTA
jgi:hypothetical protein